MNKQRRTLDIIPIQPIQILYIESVPRLLYMIGCETAHYSFAWEHWTHVKKCRIYGPRYREDRRFQRGTIDRFSLPSNHCSTDMINMQAEDCYLKTWAHRSFHLLDSNTFQHLQALTYKKSRQLWHSAMFHKNFAGMLTHIRSWHRLDMQTCNQSMSGLQGWERNKHKSSKHVWCLQPFKVFQSVDLCRDPPLSAGTRDEIGRIGRLTSAEMKFVWGETNLSSMKYCQVNKYLRIRCHIISHAHECNNIVVHSVGYSGILWYHVDQQKKFTPVFVFGICGHAVCVVGDGRDFNQMIHSIVALRVETSKWNESNLSDSEIQLYSRDICKSSL